MNRLDLIAAWARLLRAPRSDIVRLVLTAPHQYKHYQIPKRTGGVRDIFHPTPSLKAIQRWLVSEIFSGLPVHEAVYSYRSGSGIRSHALQHLHSNYLLRLDFRDFFPSLDFDWINTYLTVQAINGHIRVEAEAVPLVARVVCRYSKLDGKFALSIGAPSSPALSNAALYELDDAINRLCVKGSCTYTRYADDIYISTREPGTLNRIERDLRSILVELVPKLKLNEAKTLNVSKKRMRIVTGVVLTPDRKLSIGRQLKRSIRTQVYLRTIGRLSQPEYESLRGMLAFVSDVEPTFFASLEEKFGRHILQEILGRSQ